MSLVATALVVAAPVKSQALSSVEAAQNPALPNAGGTSVVTVCARPSDVGNAQGLEVQGPCMDLYLPMSMNSVAKQDTIRIRFRAAHDTGIDADSLVIEGRRFGISRNITNQVRAAGLVDETGISMPMRDVPSGHGTVSISIKDKKQREVRYTVSMTVVG